MGPSSVCLHAGAASASWKPNFFIQAQWVSYGLAFYNHATWVYIFVFNICQNKVTSAMCE